MIVFGGMTETGKTNSVFSFNISTRQWSEIKCKYPPLAVDGHISFMLDKQNMIIFGGRKSNWISTNTIHSLDLFTHEWSLITPKSQDLPIARVGHGSVFDKSQEKMIVFGGYDDKGQFLGRRNDVWTFDFTSFTWKEIDCTGKIPPEICNHKTVLLDTKLVTFGGWDNNKIERNDTYELDIKSMNWSLIKACGDIPASRRNHAVVAWENQMVLFGGFGDYETGKSRYYNDIYLYSSPSTSSEPTIPKLRFEVKDDQIIRKILMFGTGFDLLMWSKVCKKWQKICNDYPDWKSLYSARILDLKPKFSKNSIVMSRFLNENYDGMTYKTELLPGKRDFVILQNLVDFCDDLREFKVDFITNFVGLTELKLVKSKNMLDSIEPNSACFIGVFSTKFQEYPLIKNVMITDGKHIASFFSPYMAPNQEMKLKIQILEPIKYNMLQTAITMSTILGFVDSGIEIQDICTESKTILIVGMSVNNQYCWSLKYTFSNESNVISLTSISSFFKK